jgi:crotonyl-CoA carboxylase/reductase
MVSTAIVSKANDLYELGDVPELGFVPNRMLAQVIRAERFGEPRDAFKEEAIEIPELGPRDVLVYVMAAGVNYNNVWAAMGIPIDVIQNRI